MNQARSGWFRRNDAGTGEKIGTGLTQPRSGFDLKATALLATAVVALLAVCAARGTELQEDDASITALQNKWLEKPDFRLRRAEDLGSLIVVPRTTVEVPLRRGYELNGNRMCCGSIDVSNDPVVTGRTVITPETEFNVLDAQASPPIVDICWKYGLHRVENNDGKGWRCRK